MQKFENLENSFVHLRVQTDYSLGRSTNKIVPLVKEAVKYNMPALCIADYGNLFGSLEFSMECIKNGVKPLIGCIIKTAIPQYYSHTKHQHNNFWEFFLIAKSDVGYQNLLYLVSHSFLDHQEGPVPHITLEQLFARSEDIVLLCPATSGIIRYLFDTEKFNVAEELVQKLNEKFCGNFFIEFVRDHNIKQDVQERFALDLAYKYDIPIVATNPISYLTSDMQEAQDALICITEGRYILEEDRIKANPNNYFKSPKEMVELFRDLPEAIENTALIAIKCSAISEERAPMLPKFAQSIDSINLGEKNLINLDQSNESELLAKSARSGLEEKIIDIQDQDEKDIYFQRLEFELAVINKMNFPGYFLIVSDFIKWSKSKNIPVGPGRGSGVGSIVAWALDITDLDPIKFGLLFERFLNPERVSMPDFDIDFCQERRDEVIEYVRKKYGDERVAQIITFGKLQARAVLRDVGRVMQLPYGLIDKMCKAVPHNPANPITLKEAIQLDKDLQLQRESDQNIDKLLSISLQLEGINRHVSTHAAGIVIADRPIIELAPLYCDSNSSMPAVQYSLKYTEAAGLIKFDFLGLKTLTVISKACELINKRILCSAAYDNDELSFDIRKIPLDDKKTYAMLSRGETIGVFQFEGAGMRGAIKNLKPDCIGDLMALASLYRPGPMDNIPSYIKRKHGFEKVMHIHHKLEDLLQETYGIIIYQEQVMEIAKILAGYSLGEADLLRRAMGKKNKAEMEKLKEGFINGAISNKIEKEQAAEIFALVEKFASYGFNKSHAAAYSIISYQTAYIKAHYSLEFFTASINLDIHDSDKINIFCSDAKHFGIKILPPDINISNAYFVIEGDAIRFGLAGIKNIGIAAMELLTDERNKNGKFLDIFDLLERCQHNIINKRAIEYLAKSSALDSISSNRRQVFENAELLIKHSNIHHNNSSLQINLFASSNQNLSMRPELGYCEDWNEKEKLKMEFEALGFYLSSHPVSEYDIRLRKLGIVPSNQIEQYVDKTSVKFTIAGVVINKKIRSTNRGKFAFLQISDQNGIMDVSIFNEQILYEQSHLIVEGHPVLCEVEAKKDPSGIKVIIDKIYDLDSYMSKIIARYAVYVKAIEATYELYEIIFGSEKLNSDKLQNNNHVNNEQKTSKSELYIIAVFENYSIYFESTEPIYIVQNDITLIKNIYGVEVKEI